MWKREEMMWKKEDDVEGVEWKNHCW